ncbi:helix-turn-helix domain-containing protein [Mannheimia sp. E30BD]|uniref:helix-turn-helix domain-containing protein n=1 Tax=Mannheimia sp. E30BD TaxID=3278708 RepID=UPI00359E4D25
MNNIDTKIRHTTEADNNIFEDLGFSSDEAQKLKSASQQLIETKLMLMNEMSNWIDENKLKQSEAASILGVSRPRISDMVNGKLEKFTLDTLVTFVAKTGKTVQLQLS